MFALLFLAHFLLTPVYAQEATPSAIPTLTISLTPMPILPSQTLIATPSPSLTDIPIATTPALIATQTPTPLVMEATATPTPQVTPTATLHIASISATPTNKPTLVLATHKNPPPFINIPFPKGLSTYLRGKFYQPNALSSQATKFLLCIATISFIMGIVLILHKVKGKREFAIEKIL